MNPLARAFIYPPTIPVQIGEYTIKEMHLTRYIDVENSSPLRYNKLKKELVYYFSPYVMPYGTFVSIIEYMNYEGILSFLISEKCYTEEEIRVASKDTNAAVRICNLNSFHRANTDAYVVFEAIPKPSLAISTLSFDDMGGLL